MKGRHASKSDLTRRAVSEIIKKKERKGKRNKEREREKKGEKESPSEMSELCKIIRVIA